MNRVDSVRDELNRVTELLATTASVPEWSPEWISDQGLLQRQAELAHELDLLEGKAEIEVRLVGGAERDTEVDARFLGEFIQHFQLTIASLVQAITYGERTLGPLPTDVTEGSRLRVAASTPGSFVLHMSGPERHRQLTIDMGDQRPPFDEAVDRVLDLIDATRQEESIDTLGNAIAEFQSPRALNHVTELSRSVARTATTATITGRSPFAEEPRQSAMTTAAAVRLQSVLTATERRTQTEYRTGLLSGIRWRSGIFDLEEEIAGEVGYVSGRVRSDLRPVVSSLFDRKVRAQLERTTIRLGAGGVTKDSYLLTGVTLAEED